MVAINHHAEWPPGHPRKTPPNCDAEKLSHQYEGKWGQK
jgi:hypothetical protein